ncbi:MAG: Uma2 family endonuclease [Myxococcales bacterium]|nr:Uma2 family endonuclease [Myxococcales bacterium]
MVNVAHTQRISAAEYLALERASTDRHEFLDGEIFLMAGGTHEHSLIASNIVGELRNALRHRPCLVHGSDMKVKIEAAGVYTYPDALALCGPPQFADDARDTLLNPKVLFEVLSDSTERYDRGEKFEYYRSLPSVAEIVLVSQKKPHVEHYARKPDGSWLYRDYHAGDRVPLAALDCALAVADIYLKVFPPPADDRPAI